VDIDKIIEKMKNHICLIEYTSLISGTKKSREMTLSYDVIPKKHQLFKNLPTSNKMIAYDIEFQRWDDIDPDTILSWKVIS
jgi:hypothetical protein|tara:strand:+ start:9375 stop:9617 length:243 start_codon:yes stop_codon:yes gene_type:complete